MALRRDERAISHILGTMMVIGIAVTLAILVGIMLHHVAKEKGNGEAPPALGAVQMDGNDEIIRIVKVPPEMHLRWGEELVTEGTCVPLLNGLPFAASVGDRVEVQDELRCSSGETLNIVYDGPEGGSILYRFQFD